MPQQFMTWRPFAGRRALVAVLVASLVFSVAVSSAPTGAQASDPQAERDRLRSERAALAAQVDTLQADNSEVDRALRDLEDNLRAEQAQLTDSRRAADEAVKRAFEAQLAADARAAEVEELQSRMGKLAVDAYVNPPGHDMLDRLKADTATDAAEMEALLKARATRVSDLVDQLRAARRELEQEQSRAEQARVDAEQRAAEAEERLGELEAARAQQAQFAAGVEQRLIAKLTEADALASVDAELAGQIMAEQQALADRLAAVTPPPGEPATPPLVDPPGDGPPATTPPVATPPPTAPPPVVIPAPGTPPLRTVRGITVNTSIADRLEALLAAAQAGGFVLGGSGYRDINQQIALRRAHCGTSDFAIYQMNPMLCSPPTAIPGLSMHEKGLAVDFTWNGRAITSQSSPAFQWMAANAGRFGFINLPSEPWHWSVTGG